MIDKRKERLINTLFMCLNILGYIAFYCLRHKHPLFEAAFLLITGYGIWVGLKFIHDRTNNNK